MLDFLIQQMYNHNRKQDNTLHSTNKKGSTNYGNKKDNLQRMVQKEQRTY